MSGMARVHDKMMMHAAGLISFLVPVDASRFAADDKDRLIAATSEAFGVRDECGKPSARAAQAADAMPGDDADIIVCGARGERHRLSAEERRIAGSRRTPNAPIPAPDPLSREAIAETQNGLMKVSRLPPNWVSMGGRFGRPPAPNAAFEQLQRAEAAAAAAAAETSPATDRSPPR